MTQATHDEVIAWIDEQIELDDLTTSRYSSVDLQIIIQHRASLIANRAGLERHKRYEGNQDVAYCDHCLSMYNCGHCAEEGFTPHFPCSSYTDIADPIRSVM